ncbi:MAG: alpha/beta fold hydrolase [Vicinamibacterales bacterium]
MRTRRTPGIDAHVAQSADTTLSRREFVSRTAALGVAGAALSTLGPAWPGGMREAMAGQAAASGVALDLAEWSYFWLGVERARLARGTVVNGEQMYVEYWIPSQLRHPYPMVIVHGGGGQGLDWFVTPDGRPGWVSYLLQEGYAVYLVDRPGHGRSPFHPELHGAFPPRAAVFSQLERQFTAPEKAADPYGPEARLHTQWPGPGVMGDPTVDQVIAGQGGSFLPDLAATHAVWARRGGELLDRIGPSIIMAHSMGGPSCWIYANARPGLVKGIIAVEPNGPPFGNLRWGVTASPLEFDPPVSDVSELQSVEVPPPGPGRSAYRLLAQPRRLRHLQGIPIAVVTAPASYHYPYDLGTVAFLRQCGCAVEHIELETRGITGNAHFMMMERNNREVLAPILEFLQERVTAVAPAGAVAAAARRPGRAADESTAMRLADQGGFWVGVQRQTAAYGSIVRGQTWVQYLVPAVVRHPLPVVLVHGGTGQMLHYMGPGGGSAGWAHYYVQAGYRVFLVDRPGHGRAVYHPDALGPITSTPTYEQILPDFRRAARGPVRRWDGTAELGDPGVDQFMASQNGMPVDYTMQMALWATAGGDLLDRIGPAIVQTHSAGGPFGWLVAEARPRLVRAVVCFEGAGAPLVPMPPLVAETRAVQNLDGVPMMYLTAANSGRTQGPAIVQALTRAGARAEHLNLGDLGIPGNGHFAMIESNRKQVFDVIAGWLSRTLPA